MADLVAVRLIWLRGEKVDNFKTVVANGYQKTAGIAPEIYVCNAVQGAEEI